MLYGPLLPSSTFSTSPHLHFRSSPEPAYLSTPHSHLTTFLSLFLALSTSHLQQPPLPPPPTRPSSGHVPRFLLHISPPRRNRRATPLSSRVIRARLPLKGDASRSVGLLGFCDVYLLLSSCVLLFSCCRHIVCASHTRWQVASPQRNSYETCTLLLPRAVPRLTL
jgi:hypothetical protein